MEEVDFWRVQGVPEGWRAYGLWAQEDWSKTTENSSYPLRLSFLMWKIKMLEMVSKVLLQFSTPCFYEYLPLPHSQVLEFCLYSRSLGFPLSTVILESLPAFSSLRIGT